MTCTSTSVDLYVSKRVMREIAMRLETYGYGIRIKYNLKGDPIYIDTGNICLAVKPKGTPFIVWLFRIIKDSF